MKMLVFCANAIDGGTAKIFYEFVLGMRKIYGNQNVCACINKSNKVKIYNAIEDIIRLPIYSEEEIFAGTYGGSLLKRLYNRAKRHWLYRKTKSENIMCMKKFISHMGADVVVIHNGGYIGDTLCNQMLEAAYACKETKKRLYVLHNDMNKSLSKKWFCYFYDKRICRQATDIITVSVFTAKRIKEQSYINIPIRVVYNGLPEPGKMLIKEKFQHLGINNAKKNVLMVGNFLENKGQYEFLQSINYLENTILPRGQKHIEVAYTFIGNIYDNDYYNKCIDFIKANNLCNSISIHNGINNAAEYMDIFDVLVVPSIYDESFGLISCEAMANGVPVVAFACGGIPEVVKDKRDGLIVPVNDAAAMAKCVYQIITDEELASRLGKNGRDDYKKRFSVDAMIEEYCKIINQ